jgi:rhamnosyltransferase
VSYAEDQLLARDMLAAGYAKAYEPGAGVIHSHSYPPGELFGRLFDEFRALREVHGWVEPADPRRVATRLRREVARDRAYLRATGGPVERGTLGSIGYHAIRAAAGALGSRADRLPDGVRRALSRDGRAEFERIP